MSAASSEIDEIDYTFLRTMKKAIPIVKERIELQRSSYIPINNRQQIDLLYSVYFYIKTHSSISTSGTGAGVASTNAYCATHRIENRFDLKNFLTKLVKHTHIYGLHDVIKKLGRWE